jgi:hypothetical protein
LTGYPNPVIIHTSQQGADMTRTEIEALAQQMEKFADFLFAQGENGAGNRMLDAVDVAEAQLED